ncbi:MAG: chromate transporter [Rikenellaceae bacterium]
MGTETKSVTLWELFSSFLKIGIFTFGGGYAMIPLIDREVIERRGWVRREDFADLLTLAQSIPGPIALNSAAFVGYQTRGYAGALASVMGIVVPSFTIILIIALGFSSIRNNEVVEAAFKAMRPVVVALIVAPTIALMKGMNILSIVVTFLSIAIFTLFELSPVILILLSVVVAVVWTYAVEKRGGKR